MNTYGALLAHHKVEIPEHLIADAEVPVLGVLQVQGDLAIIPVRPSVKPGQTVPAEGVPVIRGENGGHTHLLVGEGLSWAPVENRGQSLGVVTVPDRSAGYLLHPEHGANGLAPGAYEIRRQREQAEEIRMVAD